MGNSYGLQDSILELSNTTCRNCKKMSQVARGHLQSDFQALFWKQNKKNWCYNFSSSCEAVSPPLKLCALLQNQRQVNQSTFYLQKKHNTR